MPYDSVSEHQVDVNAVVGHESIAIRPVGLRQRLSALVSQFQRKPDAELQKCEEKLLSGLNVPLTGREIVLDNGDRIIWTIIAGGNKNETPLVLLHGFGAGVAFWRTNLEELASNRIVYAIDLLGFGRSSRSHLDSNCENTAEDWAETIEQWRQKMGLGVMNLLGHSFGGYLASVYALRHPDNVKRLLLVEPWGFAEPPVDSNGNTVIQRPVFIRMVIRLMFIFHPLSVLRLAGPLGPRIIEKVRPDLGRKYAPTPDAASFIYKYIYHCNAKCPPSGESAFKRLVDKHGFAKVPMVRRIGELPLRVPISMVFGADSWIDADAGVETQQARAAFHRVDKTAVLVDLHIIEHAGHHLYVEQSSQFNTLVNNILAMDRQQDNAC